MSQQESEVEILAQWLFQTDICLFLFDWQLVTESLFLECLVFRDTLIEWVFDFPLDRVLGDIKIVRIF